MGIANTFDWNDPVARLALVERVGTDEYNRRVDAAYRASVVETVNGYAIRRVGSMFGQLFAVGDAAFPMLDGARKHAQSLPQPVEPFTQRELALLTDATLERLFHSMSPKDVRHAQVTTEMQKRGNW